jgi:hypothetical protein
VLWHRWDGSGLGLSGANRSGRRNQRAA